jgi:cyanophycinase
LTASYQDPVNEIRVILVNRWGVSIKKIILKPVEVVKSPPLNLDDQEPVPEIQVSQNSENQDETPSLLQSISSLLRDTTTNFGNLTQIFQSLRGQVKSPSRKGTYSPEVEQSSNQIEAAFPSPQENIASLTHPSIMAIGGAEDKVHGRLILQTFFQRSGGIEARIAIIPSASRDPVAIGKRYRNIFEEMGAKSIEVIDIREQEQGTDPTWLAYIETCTGVFLTGGDQLRLLGLLESTPILEKIRSRAQLGEITLAGTSAGTPVLGQFMIAGGSSGEPPNPSLVDLSIGLRIVPEAIWDQHLHNRNRMTRLLSAVAAYPDKLGIGIDEDTCVVLEKSGLFQVIGKGSVTVIDPSEVSYNNHSNIGTTDPISIHNLRVHILTSGDQYDLHRRFIVSKNGNTKVTRLADHPSNYLSSYKVRQPTKSLVEGAIMAIGGAEDKVHGRLILQTFFQRSGGIKARIAIIPTASRDPIVIGKRYRNIFEEMGVKSIEVIDIREQEQGADSTWLAYIETCTGVFFTGGDQVRLFELLESTPILERIRSRAQLGEITLAGTSAGTPVLGQFMIEGGGSGESPNRSLVDLNMGLGIVSEAIWDQHFHNRNRMARLLSAVAVYPDKLGIGIDEDTCVVLEKGGLFQVIGKGSVTVIDPSEVSYNNHSNIGAADPVSIHNLRVHILTSGDQYNLYNRVVIFSGIRK